MSSLRTPATPFANEIVTGLTGYTPDFANLYQLHEGWALGNRWDLTLRGLVITDWVLLKSDEPDFVDISLPEFIEKLKEVL